MLHYFFSILSNTNSRQYVKEMKKERWLELVLQYIHTKTVTGALSSIILCGPLSHMRGFENKQGRPKASESPETCLVKGSLLW